MKNLFVQKSSGWCSVYNMANIFRTDHFLKYLNNDRFKGCGQKEEQEMIDSYFKNQGVSLLDVAYVETAYKMPLDPGYIFKLMSSDVGGGDNDITAYILNVKTSPHAQRHHATAVIKFEDALYYLDPMSEEIRFVSDPAELGVLFWDIWGVRTFVIGKGDERRILLFRADVIGWDKVLNQ